MGTRRRILRAHIRTNMRTQSMRIHMRTHMRIHMRTHMMAHMSTDDGHKQCIRINALFSKELMLFQQFCCSVVGGY